jgi:hypothetical protein
MKHGFLHIFGCLIPIALIFILPAFGFSSGATFTVFIILMFACHLFMMGGHSHGSHGHRGGNDAPDSDSEKKGKPSCH